MRRGLLCKGTPTREGVEAFRDLGLTLNVWNAGQGGEPGRRGGWEVGPHRWAQNSPMEPPGAQGGETCTRFQLQLLAEGSHSPQGGKEAAVLGSGPRGDGKELTTLNSWSLGTEGPTLVL